VTPLLQLHHTETVCWTVAEHTRHCHCTGPTDTECFCSHHNNSHHCV